VQQALSAAITDRIAKQSRSELAQNSPPDSLADVLNDPSLRDTQGKINDVKRQIAELSAVYSPEYSKVQRLQAQLDSLQNIFDKARDQILSRIKTDFQASSRQEQLLLNAYNSQAHEVTGQDEKAIQYNILKRDVDSNRQLYDTMLQQMKEASIASAMRASNIRIVDAAELPTQSVSPNFRTNSILGLIGGLFLSIAVVMVRERADRTLQQPGDIRTWLDLQELGVIPDASTSTRKAVYGAYNRSKSDNEKITAEPGRSGLGAGNDARSHQVELVALQDNPTVMAEAFRSMLTSLLFTGDDTSRPRLLAFTSANPADGKTTIVSNIGIAAAEIRCRVLIIDADLRRPRMHKIFGIANEKGLVDLLRGDLEVEPAANYIVQTSIPNLYVLPAGPASNAASQHLYSPNLERLISSLRKDFDMILIDTPPMLQMTDARVVGRLVDAVVLVARSGKTTRDALIASKDLLNGDRTPILGAVLNDWKPSPLYGKYHYASYYKRPYTAQ
jgi:capsular exopolysaccharide synthesis family protein